MDNDSNKTLQGFAKQVEESTQPSATLTICAPTTKNSFDSSRWLVDLKPKLALLRGIVLTREQTAAFLSQLIVDGYTEEQARKAELWILRGDWSYRGQNARLEYADFFPTVKQWQVDDSLVVMTTDEREAMCKRWRDMGYNDGRTDRLLSEAPSPIPDMAKQLFESIKRVGILEEELATAKGRLLELEGSGAMEWRYRFEQEQVKHAATTLAREEEWTESNLFVKRLFLDEGFYRGKQAEYRREHPGATLVKQKKQKRA